MKESSICVEEPTEFASILLHSLFPEQETLYPGDPNFYETSLSSSAIKTSDDKHDLHYPTFRWKEPYDIAQSDVSLPKRTIESPAKLQRNYSKLELKTKDCSVLVTRLSKNLLSKVDTKVHPRFYGSNGAPSSAPFAPGKDESKCQEVEPVTKFESDCEKPYLFTEEKKKLDPDTICLTKSALNLKEDVEDTCLSFSEDSAPLIISETSCDKTMDPPGKYFPLETCSARKEDHSCYNGFVSDSPPVLQSANLPIMMLHGGTSERNFPVDQLTKRPSSPFTPPESQRHATADCRDDGQLHKLEDSRLGFYDRRPTSNYDSVYDSVKLNGFPELDSKNSFIPYNDWGIDDDRFQVASESSRYDGYAQRELPLLSLSHNIQKTPPETDDKKTVMNVVDDIKPKIEPPVKEFHFGTSDLVQNKFFDKPEKHPDHHKEEMSPQEDCHLCPSPSAVNGPHQPENSLQTESTIPETGNLLTAPSSEADGTSSIVESKYLEEGGCIDSIMDVCRSGCESDEDSEVSKDPSSLSQQCSRRKVSPLTVYTNVDGTSIMNVICKRYKKRSVRKNISVPSVVPLPTKFYPKFKRKSSSSSLKSRLREEPQENVEETVADILGDLLNRVFFMSVKREKTTELNSSDPRTRDLVERFCADYSLNYEEFRDTDKLFSLRIVEKDDENSCNAVIRRRQRRKLSGEASVKVGRDDQQSGEGESSDEYRVLRKLPGRIKRKHLRGGTNIKKFYTRSSARKSGPVKEEEGEKPPLDELLVKPKEEEDTVVEEEEPPMISDAPLVIDITDDEDEVREIVESGRTRDDVEKKPAREDCGSEVKRDCSPLVVDGPSPPPRGEGVKDERRSPWSKIVRKPSPPGKSGSPPNVEKVASSRSPNRDDSLERKHPPHLVPADGSGQKPCLQTDGSTSSSTSKHVSKEIKFPSRFSRERKRVEPQRPYNKRPAEDDQKFAWSVPKRRYTMSMHEDSDDRRPNSAGTGEDVPHAPKLDTPLDLTSNDSGPIFTKPKAPVQKVNPTVQPKKVLHARFVNEMALEKQKEAAEDDILSGRRSPPFCPPQSKDIAKRDPSPQMSMAHKLEEMDIGPAEESAAERQAREREESILRTLLLDSGRLTVNVPDEDGNYNPTPIITKVMSLSDGRTASPPLPRSRGDRESAICPVPPLLGATDTQLPPQPPDGAASLTQPPPLQRNQPFELFKDGMPHLKEQTIMNLLREGQKEAWINDPQQMKEKIRKLKNEIVYLHLVAEQKEKERVAILCFKKYKEEVLRRVYKLHSMTKQESHHKRYPAGEEQVSREYPPPQHLRHHHSHPPDQQPLHQKTHQDDKTNPMPPPPQQPTLRPILPKSSEHYQGMRDGGSSSSSSSQLHPAYFAGCNKGTCLVRPLILQEGRKNTSESLPSVEALVAKANENYGVNLNHLHDERDQIRKQTDAMGMGEILQRVLSGREYRSLSKDPHGPPVETSPPALLDQGYSVPSMMSLKNNYHPSFIPLKAMSSRAPYQSQEEVLNYSKSPPFYKEPSSGGVPGGGPGGKPTAGPIPGHVRQHPTESPPNLPVQSKPIPPAPRNWNIRNDGGMIPASSSDGHRGHINPGDSHRSHVPNGDTSRTHISTSDSTLRTRGTSGDIHNRTHISADPQRTHVASGDPHRTHITPGDPHRTHVAPGDPHRTHVSPGDPHRTHVSPGDPHRTHVSPGDPHRTHVSPGDPHRTHVSPGDSHRTHVAHGDPHRTHVAPGDPHRTHAPPSSSSAGESRSVIRHSNVITCPSGPISPLYVNSPSVKYQPNLQKANNLQTCPPGDMKEKLPPHPPRSEGSYVPDRRNENRPVIVSSVMPCSGLLPFGNKMMRTSLDSSSVPSCPRCMGCGLLDAKYLCSGCRKHWYCSPECQSLRWPEHSRVCVGRAFQSEAENYS